MRKLDAAVFSQQLSLVYTSTTVTIGLISPRSSGISVEVSAPQAVVLVPPCDVFSEPM